MKWSKLIKIVLSIERNSRCQKRHYLMQMLEHIVMLNSYIEIWYGGLQKARDPALTPVLVIIINIMLSILWLYFDTCFLIHMM